MQLCCSQLFLVTCSIRIFIFRVGKSGKDSSHCSSRRTASTPSSSTADPFAGNDSANRTVRRAARHGGGVKLLLRCLQSIQCQYYLVFGVVKTVPLQSFARLRVPFRPCPLTLPFPLLFLSLVTTPLLLLSSSSSSLLCDTTAQQQHGERSSIHIHIAFTQST